MKLKNVQNINSLHLEIDVDIVIRKDNDASIVTNRPLSVDANSGWAIGPDLTQSNVKIRLLRETGGEFDTTEYDETPYNRGWITIEYE